MKAPATAGAKLVAFGTGLAVLFAGSLGVARAVSPDGLARRGADGMHDSSHAQHGSTDMSGATATGAALLPGLASTQDGYRFMPEATTLASGPATPFRFRIDGPDGHPVRSFEALHERQLHLIVVRRDLSGFQHVHPARTADGTWSVSLDLPRGGTWRAFADFAPTGGPQQLTLAVDLQVPGDFVPSQGPTAANPVEEGTVVRFEHDGGEIAVTVERDGRAVLPEPYLGARGHLVAIRVGDLAYLHVHPETGDTPTVRFGVDLPAPGIYALYFDHQVGGVVRTATSTLEVRI